MLKNITVVFGLDFLIKEENCESEREEEFREAVEDVESVCVEFCEVLKVDVLVEELKTFGLFEGEFRIESSSD
jgi:hypothetical protein